MNDQDKKSKALVEFVKSRNPNSKVVKITTTRYYEIPIDSFRTPEELIEEWFKKYSIGHSHAFRDQSFLTEYFNDDPQILE